MADKAITRRLHIYVNGKEVERTLTNLRKEYAKAKAQMNRAPIGSDEWKAAYKQVERLGKELDYARKEQTEFLDSTKKTNKVLEEGSSSLNEYSESISNIIGGFKSGDLLAVQAGFIGISAGIKSAARSALAFIATPIGATIAALAAVGGVTKLWLNYNKSIAESTRLTKQLTSLEGRDLEQYRASVQATAETFDKEFNEVLRASNALSKQMKISQQEALELINDGFTRGADVGGDFLDKVKEYPVQFKNAGFSAQDFIDIATQEATGGIYNDKLLDTLKEADLALKEMTKTQRDALENAFGEKFAEEIAEGVKTGEVTTKEAISRIIDESKKIGLNYQQQQQIVADVFKGAGEDAGGFSEIILQLNEALSEENKVLNDNERATKRLSDANTEYEQSLADLFDASSSGFPAMLTNLKAISTEIFTNVLRGVRILFTSINQLKQEAAGEGQKKAFETVTEYAKSTGRSVKEEADFLIQSTEKNIERLQEKINNTGAFGNIFGTKDALETKLAENEAYLKELQLIAKGESDAFVKYQETLKNASLIENKENGNGEGNESDADSKVDNEAQKRIEKEKAIRDKVNQALDEFEKEREIQEELNRFEKDQQKEEEEVLRLEEKFAKLEEQAGEETALLSRLEEEKELQIQDIRDKYAEERLEKEKAAEAKRIEEKKKFQLKEFQEKKKFQNDLINSSIDFVGRESRLGQALLAYKGVLAAKESLLQIGIIKNKVIADTAKSTSDIAAGTAATAAVGFPQNIPLLLGFAAQVAGIISAVKGAIGIGSEIKPPSVDVPSFATGGETGRGDLGLGRNSGGFVRGTIEEDEYVIPKFVRTDPEVPQVIDYLETKRQEKLSGIPSANTSSQSSVDANAMYAFSNAIYELIDKGVYAKNIWNNRELDKFDKEYNKLQKTKQTAKINS